MTLQIPKPLLSIPKVPNLALLGILAAQILIFANPGNPDPKCTLKVAKPHHSTSLKELRGIDAIKLNITSECNVPQKFTSLRAELEMIHDGSKIYFHKFPAEMRYANLKNPRIVTFQDLYVECLNSPPVQYRGRAEGEIHLINGDIVKVLSDSGKFNGNNCRISAN